MTKKIKLKELVTKLNAIIVKHGNLPIRVDNEFEVGWYDLEKVKVEIDIANGEKFVNLKSSNES